MNRNKQTKIISLLGIGANLFLSIIKMIIGLISRSQGMIADGLNSTSDIISSVMGFMGGRMSEKPKDDDHPYGHGKAEYLFSMFISIVMLVVSGIILKNSILSIIQQKQLEFSWWLVVICIVTIIIKLALYIYTNKAWKIHDSILIRASAEDNRNDIFLTTSTLIGIIASMFGVYWLDGVVGVGISIWIFITAVGIFKTSFDILMDSDENLILKEDIITYVSSCSEVGHIDSIIAKPVGVTFLIVLKISVDGKMTVSRSHDLASRLKYTLIKDKRIADVVVHINPL